MIITSLLMTPLLPPLIPTRISLMDINSDQLVLLPIHKLTKTILERIDDLLELDDI